MGDARQSVAAKLAPAISTMLGDQLPVRFRFWDDSVLGSNEAATTLHVRSPLALRYLIYAPGELGLARAYVSGALDLEGDVYTALSLRDHLRRATMRPSVAELVRAGLATRAIGLPPPPPREEVRLSGGRHSKARDAAAISYHYDISNAFYRLVLGETMTYSCAFFTRPGASLDDAQRAKYELVCRKLALRPGARLLDIGCGWGGMVLHAAEHFGVEAVGITLSKEQASLATSRVERAGLAGKVAIRLQDYRDIDDGPYDAICSIGMFEHVGVERLREYFQAIYRLLRPQARVLNHGISRPNGALGRAHFTRRSFVERYVFPDGELHEVGAVASLMQSCGLEVRDVECLREHYAQTLRCWVANLEANWDEAVQLVGAPRARIWRLYMAASALNFAANRTSIHQVLAVRTGPDGSSAMAPTRAEFFAEAELSELKARARTSPPIPAIPQG